jgi:DNA-binding transcriptional ArsR family regulator
MKPIELITGTHALLSDRTRLAIMATLAAAAEPVDFNALLGGLKLTRGNLSSHIRKLEEGGLLKVEKEFLDRRPHTIYRCTELGHKEVQSYLQKVEQLLKGALPPAASKGAR